MKTEQNSNFVPTTDGRFLTRYSARGLAGLVFPGGKRSPRPLLTPVVALPAPVRRWHRATTRALRRMLAGRPPGNLPPLDLSAGTVFQQKVWNALRHIPSGATRSYSQIAIAIGRPKAVRAVGAACGANPIPVLVPCHRVLPSGGGLGGFSAGLKWKRLLLAREGISLSR
jgi:methylated-DNA-[protein]-cysteine S-methyltransferase